MVLCEDLSRLALVAHLFHGKSFVVCFLVEKLKLVLCVFLLYVQVAKSATMRKSSFQRSSWLNRCPRCQ